MQTFGGTAYINQWVGALNVANPPSWAKPNHVHNWFGRLRAMLIAGQLRRPLLLVRGDGPPPYRSTEIRHAALDNAERSKLGAAFHMRNGGLFHD